ncbi:MAG: type II secretion system F family protein [Anaerolineae bacterium]|nr:type II secretion system F family protein [Anaerolineae bacterium]
MPSPLIILGIVIVVVVVLVIAAFSIRAQRRNELEDRLGRYSEVNFLDLPQDKEEDKPKKKEESALAERLDKVIAGQDFAKSIKQQLSRADLKLTVSEYLALHVVTTIGVAALMFLIIAPGQIVWLIIGGGIGAFLPRIIVAQKQASRLKKFEQQLPDLLGLWVNSLRSGYSNMQSLEAIAREAPPPASGEIRRVVQEVQLGIPQEDAFDHLLERMPSDDLDLIVTAINVQREVGGNLAEILETIGHTIRERIKLKGEIAVLTAQGRITGWLISGLPIVLGLFLMLINPGYMGRLVENRNCGWPMIGIGLGMIGMGAAAIQKIVDIEL